MLITAISVNLAIQYTVVAVLILAAIGYLIVKVSRRKSGADDCSCGCSSCALKNSCNRPDNPSAPKTKKDNPTSPNR